MAIKTNLPSMEPRRLAYKTQIVLPSHGFTNPKAWPEGRLTVYPWDSDIDEFLLENSRRASSRTSVLFDLVAKLCDLNGAKVEDFLADEANIVLLVARAIVAEGTLTYTAMCPFCGTKSAEKIKVPEELDKVAEKAKDYPGFDTITLPKCKDVVKVRPLTIKDERIVLDRPAEDRAKVSDNKLRNILRLVSVNNTTGDSAAEWRSWFEALSPRDAKYLEDQARALSPHLETAIPHRCGNEACNRDFTYNLTFDQDFFR